MMRNLFILLLILTPLCALTLLSTRSSINVRRQRLKVISAQEFEPQFDPNTGFVSLGIIAAFSYIQVKLRQNANIQGRILELEGELKKAKAKQLSGGSEEQADVKRKVADIQEMLQKEIETKTFLNLPGLQLRFRVNNRIESIRAEKERLRHSDIDVTPADDVDVDEGSIEESYVYTMKDSSSDDRNFSEVELERPEAPKWEQTLLVGLSGVVVIVLSYLLLLMSGDPMSSSMGTESDIFLH